MAKKTQNEKIINYLSNKGSITPIQALEKFGCFRLAARIADLRSQGHTIWTESVTKNGKTFASYSLNQKIKLLK